MKLHTLHTHTHTELSSVYPEDNNKYQLFKQQTSKFQCYHLIQWILCINIIPAMETVNGSYVSLDVSTSFWRLYPMILDILQFLHSVHLPISNCPTAIKIELKAYGAK